MSAKPSIGKDLFDTIVKHDNPVSFLQSMVRSNPPTVESEYFDCKGAKDRDKPLSDSDLKRTWSEALAGFATTSGGVLVWGLDARRQTGDTVDQVCGLNLVPNPFGLLSRLQQLQHQSTDPPVPNVEVRAYVDPHANGAGFVVCYVPESDYKPHRTEIGGKRWLMRIADSFVDVPPSVLRSLFFPQRNSYITMRLFAECKTEQSVRLGLQLVKLSLHLLNSGPATATQMTLLLTEVKGMDFGNEASWTNLPAPEGMNLRCDQQFHPGQILRAPPMQICIPYSLAKARELGRGGDIDLEFRLFANDQVTKGYRFKCKQDEILHNHSWDALPQALPEIKF